MNANELAEIIEHLENARYIGASKAATMLRQQQALINQLEKTQDYLYKTHDADKAEIEALKLQLHTTLTNRDLRTYDGKTEMNNEPVAWMSVELNGRTVLATYEFETAIPLYTHPVEHDLGIAEAIGFEKGYQAGLKKAQEK